MALVEVKDLVKRYTPGGVNAVDHLTFEIQQGEIFSLLGPNGAGKTTAISMLSTLLPATEGEAVINGYSVRRNPMAVRRSIGVVPQDLALYGDLSALENLRFWGEMRGLRGATLKREIDEKLALMELTERANDRVQTFSGGMKRRLNLAVGLLGNPPLVMLDEPTVAIDPQSRRYILDWVKKMNAQGLTVLYTTHYMEEAEELSRRIGIIDHGKLIALGTLSELVQQIGSLERLTVKITPEEKVAPLMEALRAVDGGWQIAAQEEALVLNVPSAEAALSQVLKLAGTVGAGIRTIEIREPDLETVFLSLTGRALRD
jgi:ABC-2 type transport system ATP-binding protein